MKYFKKQHEKLEKKYCEKHGRARYLEFCIRLYKILLILLLLSIIFFTYSLTVSISIMINHDDFSIFGLMYYIGTGLSLILIVLLIIRLPFYRKLSIACKKEQNKKRKINHSPRENEDE